MHFFFLVRVVFMKVKWYRNGPRSNHKKFNLHLTQFLESNECWNNNFVKNYEKYNA